VQPLKVLSIVGTRPEAIKMAPVIRELGRQDTIVSSVCVTGQHREMLDQVLNLFNIVPDYDLNVMFPNQTLNQLVSRIISALEPLLDSLQPDWILVQGDTTTVMTAAIAARHRKIKIGHVEAGLRTGDMNNPFPEEMNRVIVDSISDLNFVPTPRAFHNLLREGICGDQIEMTGNTVIDALLDVACIGGKASVNRFGIFVWLSRRLPKNPKRLFILCIRYI
jgi:UDP-N-acetylglucosamine 2-epimerase (non-hydrolysing)